MVIETAAAASLTRLVQPLVKDLYEGAKKVGARGFLRWEQRGFPAKLGRRIRSIESVRTLWKPDAISLRDFFHPPKLIVNEKSNFLGRLSELPSNAVVIEGIVGQGKSVFLRSLAVEEIRSNDAKRLPVFLELKDLNSKLDLRQAIFKQLQSYDIDIDDDSLNYLFRSGKIALLLDGFDEIEEGMVKSTFLEIEHLSLRYPELQVVVSSRPGHEIQKSSGFTILKIAQLVPSEFAAFLAKLGVSSEKSLSLRQAIRNSPSKISNLINTPLMLTLVVIVYEAESQIPETLPEFFERLFQTVFSRHDRIKAAFTRKHHCGLSERSLQMLFEAFCFMTLQLGYGRSLSQTQFDEVFELAIDYAESGKCESESFRQDIVKVACLMLEDGVDSITFLHKSILEYYAAAFVKRLNESNAQLFYGMAVQKSQGWHEVLTFLKAIDSFRYAANYLIPAIRKERLEIVAALLGGQIDPIPDWLMSLYPDLGVYFRTDSEDPSRARVGAYGSFFERSGDFLAGLGFLLMDALGETLPDMISTEELQTRFGAFPDHAMDSHGAHVPARLLILAYGSQKIRSALEKYQSRLDALEIEANAVIAREDKKKLIFDRKSRA